MYTLRIEQDTDPINPRTEWDNPGKLCLHHSRYNLPNEANLSVEEIKQRLESPPDDCYQLTVYGYAHGGLTINTTGFNCPWDSGILGIIFITHADALREYDRGCTPEKIMQYLANEVETYNQYLTGDCWGYVIENENGDVVDSCHGYFGRKYCEEEGQMMLKHHQEREVSDNQKLQREMAL